MAKEKQHAFMKAYKPCHERFIRYCSALAYGKMDTEDLVQDVLLSTYLHFEKIRNKEELIHYLIRAARNSAISKWRKQKYQIELLEKHHEKLVAQGVSPDSLFDIDLLYKTLNKLPEKQKTALILFEISGFSIKEIAEIQQSQPGAVKTRISRGRQQLRRILGPRPTSRSVNNLLGIVQNVIL